MNAVLFDLDGTLTDPREGITRCIAYALERMGIEPDRAAMIGDRGVDMRAARHHGVRAIGALWGYGSVDELEAAGAHSLCANPSALPDAVASY